MSISLDGFIAGPEGGAADVGLHDWLTDGDTPSRINPAFRLSKQSAAFLDEGVGTIGAVIAGRRTYDLSNAWRGRGPMPGRPLLVVTHRQPHPAPASEPPFTFVTGGVECAVAQARAAVGDKDVHLMGASIIQQALRAGLLDELVLSLVPIVLGDGVRLLEALPNLQLEVARVIDDPGVTHLTYKVTGSRPAASTRNSAR